MDYRWCRSFCRKLTRFKRALTSVPPFHLHLRNPQIDPAGPGQVTAQKIAHTQFKKMSPVWVLGGNVQPFERVSGAGVLGAITISRAGDCALALVLWARTRVCFTLPQMATRPPPT